MSITLPINNEIMKYWALVKNANDEIKLNLISLLSLSISNKNIDLIENDSEDIRTSNFLNKFSCSWHGNETPEEIIEIIKSNRSSKNPPLFD